MGRVFHGQPGAGAGFFQQWRGGKFGGEAVKGDGLQVIRRLQTRQERRQWHRAIGHAAFVGHVIGNLHGLRLRVLEQVGGLPGLAGVVQFDGQLCSGCRKAQQQGK